ncbi:MAG: ABC transporter permease [Deltaproteobacteria bacterium]|nr:MAG: ABC transporter permease [Deltaproteobacteria bacterium]
MVSANTVWFWRLLLVVILLGIAAGVGGAIQKIDYTWRWKRVPQYFVYLAEDPQKIPFDGTVTKIEESGKTIDVTLRSETGEEQVVTVTAGTLGVSKGDELFEGDTVGFRKGWRPGPLLKGLWVTLWLSAISSCFALIIGLVTGLAKISKNLVLRGLAVIYIECIRGTPLLVQIFLAYFFLGTVFHLDREICGVGALALFAGAYVAEIIRAGIQAIPKGQTEAARSLGMTATQAMIEVVLPQAFKKILPPLSGQFISLIKDSSLVSIIAITDLTKSGREIITSTFATFEVWLVVAAMYLLITSVLSQIVYYMERRYAVSD